MTCPTRRAVRCVIVVLACALLHQISSTAFGQTECTPPASGLVGWWRAEGDASDQAGVNNGALTGVGFTAGKVGQAFSLSGFNCGVLLTNPAGLQLQDFTIEAWIKRASNSRTTLDATNGFLFGSSPGGYGFILADDGRLQLAQVGGATVSSTNTVTDISAFHHVAVTKSGSSVVFYLDGAEGSTVIYNPSFTFGGAMGIGTRGNDLAQSFFGLIDEVSIYNRALTAAEIHAVFIAGSFGKCTGPATPYIFLQPTNQTVQAGATAMFSVGANGTPPLRYQWLHEGTNLTGSTGATLTLSNVQTSNAGSYSVLVTNDYGWSLSSNAVLTLATGPACAPVSSGLVGWWPGEGNAGDVAGTNNGVSMNGAGFAAGEVKQSFSFNGVNQFVQIPDAPELDPTNLTVEGWFYFPAYPSISVVSIVDKESPNVRVQYQLTLWSSQGNWYFRPAAVVSGNLFYFGGNTPVQPGTWYHVAETFDGSSLKLYVNGSFDGSIAAIGKIDATPYPLMIGGPGSGPWFFNGRVDELSLYNRALSASEIQQIYLVGSAGKCAGGASPSLLVQPTNQIAAVGENVSFAVAAAGSAPLAFQWLFYGTNIIAQTNGVLNLPDIQLAQAGPYSVMVSNAYGWVVSSNAVLAVNQGPGCVPSPAGLVGWWPGQDNADDAVAGDNGTILNGVTFIDGLVKRAFNFDGVNGAVVVPASSNLNVKSFTVETWIYPTDLSTPRPIVEYANPTGICSMNFWYNLNPGISGVPGALYALVRDGTNSSNYVDLGSSQAVLIANQWNHVAVTFDAPSRAVNLFANGQNVASNTAAAPLLPDTLTAVNFGYRPIGSADLWGGRRHLGGMDEVSIYNRALSAGEIQAIYNSAHSGKCPLPVTIIAQPSDQSVAVGNTASLSVLAAGSPPLTYQWSFNGAVLTGATSRFLVLTDVQTNQGGTYSVLVTNLLAAIPSSNAILTVLPAPGCSSPSSNLVSWWRAEGNALDQVGGNNGALAGNVSYVQGRVGQGFVFDGSGDAVQLGTPASLQLQNFTVEGWIRRTDASLVTTGTGGFGVLLGYGNGGYAVGMLPGGNLFLGKMGVDNVNSTFAIADTNFHHIAVTKSGASIVFFRDGVAYPGPNYNSIFGFSAPLALGARGDNLDGGFLGIIDELSVYSRALSSSEIQAIYDSSSAGKCVVPVSPFLIAGPASQTVTVGTSATFSAIAGGSVPLAYQWLFNGSPISGATGSSLTVTSVGTAQAGNYSLTVTNVAGSATSTNALLALTFPPATVRVPGTNVISGGIVTLPVLLAANGNENALGFSLSFDPSRLTYVRASLGAGAADAVLLPNASLINSGRLGMTVALPPGETFTAGNQEVVQISFATAVLSNSATTLINFIDQPTPRQLVDNQFNLLPVSWSGGSVFIAAAPGFEGDIYPLPGGDKSVSLIDWLLMGRFAARLDYPTNAAEFQRADCAPRATLGDGTIKVSDWVQLGRYVAGLEPLTAVGGPSNEVASAPPPASDTRKLSLQAGAVAPGQPLRLSVQLTAQGNENALGFSVTFDPAQVSYSSASLGPDGTGATLYVNSAQAASGLLGFALALGSGASLSAGTKDLVELTFQRVGGGGFTAGFGDQPVPREVADALANSLPVSFVTAAVPGSEPPLLSISQSGQNVVLNWPGWATNYVLQEADGNLPPAGGWSNLVVTPVLINNEATVTLPLSNGPSFYRLRSP